MTRVTAFIVGYLMGRGRRRERQRETIARGFAAGAFPNFPPFPGNYREPSS